MSPKCHFLHFGVRFYKILKVRERYNINTQNTTLSTTNTCIVYTDIIIIVYTDYYCTV